MWYSLMGNILGHMMFKIGKTFLVLWRKQTDEIILTSNFILIPFMKPELIFPFLTQELFQCVVDLQHVGEQIST